MQEVCRREKVNPGEICVNHKPGSVDERTAAHGVIRQLIWWEMVLFELDLEGHHAAGLTQANSETSYDSQREVHLVDSLSLLELLCLLTTETNDKNTSNDKANTD